MTITDHICMWLWLATIILVVLGSTAKLEQKLDRNYEYMQKHTIEMKK